MRTETINIHTIDELEGEAIQTALERVRNGWLDTEYPLDESEIAESIRGAANHFSMEVCDLSIDLFGFNSVIVDTDGYHALTNEERNDLVTWLSDNLTEGADGSCPFTGVVYDSYFFDAIKEFPEKVTFNTLHKAVKSALTRMAGMITEDLSKTYRDDAYMKEYATDILELEFTKDGREWTQ